MLLEMAREHPRWGFHKMLTAMKKSFLHGANHKRVYRIYCELKLNIRIKPRKRIPKGKAKMLMQPNRINICWSIDFMSDALISGVKFRTLNVIDDCNREALLISAGFSINAKKLTEHLDQIAVIRGYPDMIRNDNGPEFISKHFKKWAQKNKILLHHIQPGKPAQNAYIERFNRTYREDVLDMNLFGSVTEVNIITKEWINFYNTKRPHEALGDKTPTEFLLNPTGIPVGLKENINVADYSGQHNLSTFELS